MVKGEKTLERNRQTERGSTALDTVQSVLKLYDASAFSALFLTMA